MNHPTKISDRRKPERTHYLPMVTGQHRILCLSGFLWDILNYGRTKNRVRVQDGRFQELAVNYQNMVLKALQEMEDAMAALLKNRWPRKTERSGKVRIGSIWDFGLGIANSGLIWGKSLH